jgi:hypothetical protein
MRTCLAHLLAAAFAIGCASSSGADASGPDRLDLAPDEAATEGTTSPRDADDAADLPPALTCSARAHGATGDGVTLDTVALQAAIDACAGTGGVVVLDAGTYLSGSLELRSRMTFRLDEGATLRGSSKEADYPLGHLLYSQGADDLVLEGPGTIDGNGKPWWLVHSLNEEAFRPHPMVRLIDGRNIVVRDLTLKDSPGWHLHLLALDDVVVERVTIRAPAAPTSLSPNTDGIDVDACRRVEVAHCDVETGDDAIVIKNGDATWARESYDLEVHDCVVAAWANGFKIGTRPRAPVHGVVFRDSLVQAAVGSPAGTRVMGGVTLIADDGADVYDVRAERIHMKAVHAPFFLRVQERDLLEEEGRISQAGRLYDVTLQDLTVDDATLPGMILGIAGHPVEGVTVENVTITSSVAGSAADARVTPPERNLEYPDAIYFGTLPAFGVYARHVAGPLVFAPSVTLTAAAGEERPAVVLADVTAVDTAGLAPGTSVTVLP